MTAPTAAEWREAVEGAACDCPSNGKRPHSIHCFVLQQTRAHDGQPPRLLDDILAALRPLIARLERALDASTVRLRAADSLADAVAAHVTSGLLGERSVAADALLDYRDPPRTPRSDALAAATEAAALWEAEAGRLREAGMALDAQLRCLRLDANPKRSRYNLAADCGAEVAAFKAALAVPRPAPGKVVALVEEWRGMAAVNRRTTNDQPGGANSSFGYVYSCVAEAGDDCATALARALGMEEP